MRTTNNLVFASLYAYKTTMQHAKKTQNRRYLIQTLKQQKTFEQNTREVTKSAALDSTERFNTSLRAPVVVVAIIQIPME